MMTPNLRIAFLFVAMVLYCGFASAGPKAPASADVVKGFFAAFGRGDVEAVVAAFHPNASIVAVRKGPRADGQLHGTYAGRAGAREFVSNLSRMFETKAFSVDRVIAERNVVFANGSFTHVVKGTGKSFASDWALRCLLRDGKIFEYHFYEDSAALEKAMH